MINCHQKTKNNANGWDEESPFVFVESEENTSARQRSHKLFNKISGLIKRIPAAVTETSYVP